MSDSQARQVSKHIPLSGKPNFYLNFTGDIEDNQISLKIKKIQVGNLPISSGLVSSYTPRLIEFIEINILSHPSINFKKLKLENGFLLVVATLPDIEYVK